MSLPVRDPGLKLEAECRTATPEPADLTQQHEWNSQTVMLGHSEEFVPGATCESPACTAVTSKYVLSKYVAHFYTLEALCHKNSM